MPRHIADESGQWLPIDPPGSFVLSPIPSGVLDN